jgi:hypothetical protein
MHTTKIPIQNWKHIAEQDRRVSVCVFAVMRHILQPSLKPAWDTTHFNHSHPLEVHRHGVCVELSNYFVLTITNVKVTPEGNSDGLPGANKIPGKGGGGAVMVWCGPAFTSKFDGLFQVRPAIDSVPGVLAGDNVEWPGVNTRNQKTKDHFSWLLPEALTLLHKHNSSCFLWDFGKM